MLVVCTLETTTRCGLRIRSWRAQKPSRNRGSCILFETPDSAKFFIDRPASRFAFLEHFLSLAFRARVNTCHSKPFLELKLQVKFDHTPRCVRFRSWQLAPHVFLFFFLIN